MKGGGVGGGGGRRGGGGGGGGGGGESAKPSIRVINGSERECRRQQEIQSSLINNTLVRQQLPPTQQPLPLSTPNLPTRQLGPLDY